jgi:hypothetical protein
MVKLVVLLFVVVQSYASCGGDPYSHSWLDCTGDRARAYHVNEIDRPDSIRRANEAHEARMQAYIARKQAIVDSIHRASVKAFEDSIQAYQDSVQAVQDSIDAVIQEKERNRKIKSVIKQGKKFGYSKKYMEEYIEDYGVDSVLVLLEKEEEYKQEHKNDYSRSRKYRIGGVLITEVNWKIGNDYGVTYRVHENVEGNGFGDVWEHDGPYPIYYKGEMIAWVHIYLDDKTLEGYCYPDKHIHINHIQACVRRYR